MTSIYFVGVLELCAPVTSLTFKRTFKKCVLVLTQWNNPKSETKTQHKAASSSNSKWHICIIPTLFSIFRSSNHSLTHFLTKQGLTVNQRNTTIAERALNCKCVFATSLLADKAFLQRVVIRAILPRAQVRQMTQDILLPLKDNSDSCRGAAEGEKECRLMEISTIIEELLAWAGITLFDDIPLL